MRVLIIRVLINLLGALMGVDAIILMKLSPFWKEEIMAIEIILLPTIFIIGNLVVEELIKREYDIIVDEISEEAYNMEQRYFREQMKNAK
jgi:hypothetical protein